MITNYTISGFVAGDDFSFQRTVESGVITAWLSVKNKYTAADYTIQKRISSTTSESGIIQNQLLTFYLLPEDTEILTPYSPYPYDIQVMFVDGKRKTEELGTIFSLPQVTRE